MSGSPKRDRLDEVARPGLREHKKRRRRMVIRGAALDLFIEQGFSNTTVEQIAKRARIAPRTFFNYFSTKEECVVFLQDELGEEIRRIVRSRPPDEGPLALIRETCKAIFGTLDSIPTIRAQMIQGLLLQRNEPALRAADSAFRKVWEDAASEALVARQVDPLTAQIVGVAGVGIAKVALIEWAARGAEGPAAGAISEAFMALERAMNGTVSERAVDPGSHGRHVVSHQ